MAEIVNTTITRNQASAIIKCQFGRAPGRALREAYAKNVIQKCSSSYCVE